MLWIDFQETSARDSTWYREQSIRFWKQCPKTVGSASIFDLDPMTGAKITPKQAIYVQFSSPALHVVLQYENCGHFKNQ